MKAIVYKTKNPLKTEKNGINSLILELWIDELKVCINELNDIFRNPEPRMAYKHFGSINLTDSFCEAIEKHLTSKENFETNNSKIFDAIRLKFKD